VKVPLGYCRTSRHAEAELPDFADAGMRASLRDICVEARVADAAFAKWLHGIANKTAKRVGAKVQSRPAEYDR
jgi:hypothetical protein